VDINYNFNEQRLTVTISHNTDNTDTHYIEKVEVYKNGVNIIDEDYTSQTTSNTFTLSFNISANDGDILKVETECSIGGNTEDSLTVKSTENGTSNKNGDNSTPGFELILLGSSIAFILFLRRKKI
jgi:desulfoferrodoxin (superoxide reductase-like protein)